MTRRDQIQNSQTVSLRGECQTLIVQDCQNREFFRFEEGGMVEYEATKLNNRRIQLTDEELEVANAFNN